MAAASKYALPTVVADRDTLQSGALAYLSYSEVEQNERYASFVDRVLRGANVADLPMEQPTRFELGINLKTSRVLRLTFPRSILLRADSVID
jgi:putative ABC transport system substrate-binding protein